MSKKGIAVAPGANALIARATDFHSGVSMPETLGLTAGHQTTIDWVHRILKEERDIVISSRPVVDE